VGGLVAAFVALQMLAENNNNGELYDTVTGRWDIAYAVQFSAIFFVPLFLIVFAVTYGLIRSWSADTDAS